ncbi:MAG: type II toxin-antitoxin system PemK/MazF family toxin [Planctomycetaceae bacterium]
MPLTTSCDPGDVVLVRFPFTDLSSHKKRPAVVVSPASYSAKHGDLIVVALTSQPQADDSLRLDDWRAAGLIKATWIKPLLGTAAQTVVAKKLGGLTASDRRRIRDVLTQLIAGEFQP